MATSPDIQRVRERTSTTLAIPMTDDAGAGIVPAGLTTLTATLTSLDTGAAIFTARNVLPSLANGVLSLELTSADNARLTTQAVEQRALVVSATYGSGSGKVWHSPVVLIELEDLPGVS